MPEDHEGSISLTWRTRNLRRPLRMLERNWKRRWLLLCFTTQKEKQAWRVTWQKQMSSNQNLRVSWKPVNPQECVWKNLYQNIMRTILQVNGTIHCNIIIWYTNWFLCFKQSQQGKIWKDSGVGHDESQKQIRGDRWSKDEGRKSSFRLTDGHLSFEECWIGGKSTKNTRVELYSDVIL